MPPVPINFATEDELSENVLLRILESIGGYAVGTSYRRGGFGYLRRTIRGWNRAARSTPFLVLTDLDAGSCPAELIRVWLPDPKHPNLLFRVAVREVESWLLADKDNLADYLKISSDLMPSSPDDILDPKATLVSLAGRSRSKAIRVSIVPKRGSTAKIGPDYNGRLGLFVRNHWDVVASKANSPSLSCSYDRIAAFRPQWR